jgi:hypothetical protein
MAKPNKSEIIEWQAAEALDFKRSGGWYAILFIAAAIIIGVCIWWQQWTTIALVIVIVIAIIVVNKKPARTIHYLLSSDGLEIDGQKHDFGEYRGFGVRHDGDFWTLVLLPVKRFGTETTIFIRDEQGEKIVDLLGDILPMEQLKHDIVGKITKKLKL